MVQRYSFIFKGLRKKAVKSKIDTIILSDSEPFYLGDYSFFQ